MKSDIETLKTSHDTALRWRAAFALGWAGAPDAEPALTHALLNDLQLEARQGAAWALGTLRAQDAIPSLEQALLRPDETDEQMSYVISLSLARIGTEAALDTLNRAAAHHIERIQRAATAALHARPYLTH